MGHLGVVAGTVLWTGLAIRAPFIGEFEELATTALLFGLLSSLDLEIWFCLGEARGEPEVDMFDLVLFGLIFCRVETSPRLALLTEGEV